MTVRGELVLGLLVSVGFLAMPADTFCQSGVVKTTNRKFKDVPKATEECTPVECDWLVETIAGCGKQSSGA